MYPFHPFSTLYGGRGRQKLLWWVSNVVELRYQSVTIPEEHALRAVNSKYQDVALISTLVFFIAAC